jgi:hypothetical protein
MARKIHRVKNLSRNDSFFDMPSVIVVSFAEYEDSRVHGF